MPHLPPADLVLFQTGDLADDRAAAHLATCERCRSELAAIERTLRAFDAVEPPVPDAAYGQRIWNLIEHRLDQPAPRTTRMSWGWMAPRGWWAHAAMAAATAALVTLVIDSPTTPLVAPAAPAAAVSERVLLSAVSEHLERTGMMLTDLNTAEDAAEVFDVALLAEDLATANRLYRQSASFSGDTDVVNLLDDLERVLVEVAHASRDAGLGDPAGLRGRLDTEDMALRVRLAGTALRDRGEAL
jgi:hypothetical protein